MQTYMNRLKLTYRSRDICRNQTYRPGCGDRISYNGREIHILQGPLHNYFAREISCMPSHNNLFYSLRPHGTENHARRGYNTNDILDMTTLMKERWKSWNYRMQSYHIGSIMGYKPIYLFDRRYMSIERRRSHLLIEDVNQEKENTIRQDVFDREAQVHLDSDIDRTLYNIMRENRTGELISVLKELHPSIFSQAYRNCIHNMHILGLYQSLEECIINVDKARTLHRDKSYQISFDDLVFTLDFIVVSPYPYFSVLRFLLRNKIFPTDEGLQIMISNITGLEYNGDVSPIRGKREKKSIIDDEQSIFAGKKMTNFLSALLECKYVPSQDILRHALKFYLTLKNWEKSYYVLTLLDDFYGQEMAMDSALIALEEIYPYIPLNKLQYATYGVNRLILGYNILLMMHKYAVYRPTRLILACLQLIQCHDHMNQINSSVQQSKSSSALQSVDVYIDTILDIVQSSPMNIQIGYDIYRAVLDMLINRNRQDDAFNIIEIVNKGFLVDVTSFSRSASYIAEFGDDKDVIDWISAGIQRGYDPNYILVSSIFRVHSILDDKDNDLRHNLSLCFMDLKKRQILTTWPGIYAAILIAIEYKSWDDILSIVDNHLKPLISEDRIDSIETIPNTVTRYCLRAIVTKVLMFALRNDYFSKTAMKDYEFNTYDIWKDIQSLEELHHVKPSRDDCPMHLANAMQVFEDLLPQRSLSQVYYACRFYSCIQFTRTISFRRKILHQAFNMLSLHSKDVPDDAMIWLTTNLLDALSQSDRYYQYQCEEMRPIVEAICGRLIMSPFGRTNIKIYSKLIDICINQDMFEEILKYTDILSSKILQSSEDLRSQSRDHDSTIYFLNHCLDISLRLQSRESRGDSMTEEETYNQTKAKAWQKDISKISRYPMDVNQSFTLSFNMLSAVAAIGGHISVAIAREMFRLGVKSIQSYETIDESKEQDTNVKTRPNDDVNILAEMSISLLRLLLGDGVGKFSVPRAIDVLNLFRSLNRMERYDLMLTAFEIHPHIHRYIDEDHIEKILFEMARQSKYESIISTFPQLTTNFTKLSLHMAASPGLWRVFVQAIAQMSQQIPIGDTHSPTHDLDETLRQNVDAKFEKALMSLSIKRLLLDANLIYNIIDELRTQQQYEKMFAVLERVITEIKATSRRNDLNEGNVSNPPEDTTWNDLILLLRDIKGVATSKTDSSKLAGISKFLRINMIKEPV